MSIESELALATEDVMRGWRELVEAVERARGSGVDPDGIQLRLLAGHNDPRVLGIWDWVHDAVGALYEPKLA